MKKFLSFLLAVVVLAACLPTVFAASSASFTGPNAVRAGDTITLTFSISGDNISGVQGSVSYDDAQLTLNSYTKTLKSGWDGDIEGNSFAFFDNNLTAPVNGSASFFQVSFTVKDLEPGTEVSVSVNDVKLSSKSGEIFQDTTTSAKYTTTILPPLSDNCTLASMTVGNAEISPAFDPAVTSYSASVPFTTDSLEVEAAAEHPGAKVTIGKTSLTAGGTTTVKVTVKAENGVEKVYSIRVKRAQDPNYVPSSDATLQSLAVEGYQLSPAFSNDVKQYYVWLPYEAESLTIQTKTADRKAKVDLGKTDGLVAGQSTKIPVTVIAEDDTAVLFTITVFRAPAHGDTEAFLAGRLPAPMEPEPTEPEAVPDEPEQVPQPQPAKNDQAQYIILIGACAACLILGLLIGVLVRSFSFHNVFFVDEDDEEYLDEETEEDAEPKSELFEDMPDFNSDKE